MNNRVARNNYGRQNVNGEARSGVLSFDLVCDCDLQIYENK